LKLHTNDQSHLPSVLRTELVSNEASEPQMALHEAVCDEHPDEPAPPEQLARDEASRECELTVSNVTAVDPSLPAATVSVEPPIAAQLRKLAECDVLKQT
jgi:hypothetical protein